jgi:hypothetical protein
VVKKTSLATDDLVPEQNGRSGYRTDYRNEASCQRNKKTAGAS